MATKNFLTLEGLTTYDGLIKQYIGTEDAKSIKSISVSGNTVSFYKTADGSGTAAYTVNLPDVSGFMDKISDANTGMILTSNEYGQAIESEVSIEGLVSGYFSDDVTNGEIVIYDTDSGLVRNSGAHIEDFVTGYFDEAESGDIVIYDGDTATISKSGKSVDDLIEKIGSATGSMVVASTSEGDIAESEISVSDISGAFDDIDQLQTDVGGLQTDVSGLQTDITTLNGDIANLDDEKVDKIASAHGDRILLSTSGGGITESELETSDLVEKISNPTSGTVLVSDGSGNFAEENTKVFVTGYMELGTPASEGDIVIFGQDSSDARFINIKNSGVSFSDLQEDISDAQDAADAAQADVDALETYVGTIPQGSSATDVIGYVDEAVAEAGDDADITLVEAQTPTTGYLKTYELYQGGNAAANLVGKIDIPKDLVVTSGEIVVNPTGQPAGTYLKLTIANQTAPVYINVADLCDVYTAAQSAAQVQLAISSTNEISATIVAGSVTATELAGNAVTTAKIADDAVTADKVAISAHTEAQTAGADGVAVSVTTTDGQVSAVSASIAANTYDAYGAASTAIAALDATPSQSAGADGLALSLTEVDGVVTAISGSIASNTYDAYGSASTVQSTVIGTSGDTASADTINGAKAYADASTAAIATSDIEALFS